MATKLTSKQKDRLKKLVDLEVYCLPEYAPIEGNVLTSGDQVADEETELEVKKQVENGNDWAWCIVVVQVSLGSFSGKDYLGQCSYKSKEDFVKRSGYYADMYNEAIDDLIKVVELNEKQVNEFFNKLIGRRRTRHNK